MKRGRVVSWEGRPIEDLTKKELIEAVNRLAAGQEAMREQHALDMESLRPMPRKGWESWLKRLLT